MLNGAGARAIGRWIGLAYLLALVFSTTGDNLMSGMFDGGPESIAMRVGPQFARLALSAIAAIIGSIAWLAASLMLARLTRGARPIAGGVLLACVLGGVLIDLYAQSQLLSLIVTGASGGSIDWLGSNAQHYQQASMAWQIFYGLWMFPFGWLIARTHIAPRTIGICLIAGGCGCLLLIAAIFGIGLVGQGFHVSRLAFGVAAIVGELGSCLWLLVFGAREPKASFS